MKKYLDLVSISARIHRRESKMTRICIVLAVFLVAVMFGLADLYLQGAAQKELKTKGNWHYQFSDIGQETAELISARPEVETAGWEGILALEAGCRLGERQIAVCGAAQQTFEDIFLNSMVQGTYPESISQAAVSSQLMEEEMLALGDQVKVYRADGSFQEYEIVGCFDEKSAVRLGAGTNETMVLTGEGLDVLDFKQEAGWRYMVRLSRLCSMPETAEDIKIQSGLADQQITANESLLSIQGQVKGSSVDQIYQVAFVLSVIVMLTCVLMISSSLSSNVMQRTQFFGLMRCQGATKKQIMRFVRREALHWCKRAIPTGVGLSVVVVLILSAIMRRISPQWFGYMPVFGVSWLSIAVSVILGLLTVLLAARSPAKKAAGVSPLEAVSGSAQKTREFSRAANTGAYKIEIALGVHHGRGNKKNYFLMTGAFAVCIVLFLTFIPLVDFMKNAFMPSVWEADLSIVSENNTCSIDPSNLEEICRNPSVKRAYGRMFAYDISVVMKEGGYRGNLISLEETQLERSKSSLIEGSAENFLQKKNQVLVVGGEEAQVRSGEEISLVIQGKEHTLTVAGILSDSPLAREENTQTIFCSEETFTELTGETGYTIIDVQLKNTAGEEDVEEIESIFDEGGVLFREQRSAIQQQRNLYYGFAVLVYGFLAVIVAITIFHIMNSISMGVAARKRQYGAMRAIGMSGRQLKKMIAAEAATYAVHGGLVGCIIGIPLHFMVFSSLITNFWGIPWEIPLAPMGFIVGIVLLTTLLSVHGPAKHLGEMSIAENIGAQ